MATRAAPLPAVSIPQGALLNAIADALLVVGPDDSVRFANLAAEQLFDASAALLQEQNLRGLLPDDSPVFALLDYVRGSGARITDRDVFLESPRLGQRLVSLQASPVAEMPDCVLIGIQEQSIARRIDNQLSHRGAARSVSGMAAVLAHEVKNPLSGIRGAAQLLEQHAGDEDRGLTRLICDETDRICALVDRMEAFGDQKPLERLNINIHQVLEHVRRLSQNGFARQVQFRERYDPSLPPVYGNRDQLVQAFLNLVKNAAEAVPAVDGEITIATAYRHGVRMAAAGSSERLLLPLEITVQDNGPGIPDDVRNHLFDPFVSTKSGGTGLGLALVAKIVGDHGGVIEVESRPRRTMFRVNLPIGVAKGSSE